MNNLKGNLDIHLEEDHLGAPLPSSQVSACSAASHLSYHDSPRSQPLALAPEVEEEMSAGAVSSPSPPKRSLGLLRRNEATVGSGAIEATWLHFSAKAGAPQGSHFGGGGGEGGLPGRRWRRSQWERPLRGLRAGLFHPVESFTCS